MCGCPHSSLPFSRTNNSTKGCCAESIDFGHDLANTMSDTTNGVATGPQIPAGNEAKKKRKRSSGVGTRRAKKSQSPPAASPAAKRASTRFKDVPAQHVDLDSVVCSSRLTPQDKEAMTKVVEKHMRQVKGNVKPRRSRAAAAVKLRTGHRTADNLIIAEAVGEAIREGKGGKHAFDQIGPGIKVSQRTVERRMQEEKGRRPPAAADPPATPATPGDPPAHRPTRGASVGRRSPWVGRRGRPASAVPC